MTETTNNGAPMLEVKELSIQFGGLRAVDGLNLSVKKHQLYGLIGPNGAGKPPYSICLPAFTSPLRALSSLTA